MKSLEKKGDQEKPPPHFSQWKEGESMGLIPLVFFQKIVVSRLSRIGGNSSKRLDSLLSISGKVSELLAEEALLSLQCCNQNLVLRFSRISNKKRLSVILSKLRGEAGQQKKKSYTKSQSFGLLRKRTTSKQLREFSKNLFWPIGFLEAKSTLL